MTTQLAKPIMKSELGIRRADRNQRWIALTATADAVMEYAEFGHLYRHTTFGEDAPPSNGYDLYVDVRFDFDEVLAWVQSHDQRERRGER